MLWFAINVAVPVLLPYFMIGLIILDSLGTPVVAGAPPLWKTLLKKSVDTGQLFWTSISLLAAISYDAMQAWSRHQDMHTFIGWTLGMCIVLGIASTVLVGFGTLRAVQSGVVNWMPIKVSVGLTLTLTIAFPLLHFQFA